MKRFTPNKLSIACIQAVAVMAFGHQCALAETPAQLSAGLIEEVEVVGIRRSLAEAIDRKRDNTNVVDAIVASDIGKMPDRNIAEAMQRITGVTIGREDGEGTSISIRGITDNLNTTTINGQTIASAGEGRGIDFSSMPASMITAVEVFKSPMAKHVEGSIGGLVNLVTARPLDVGETKGTLFTEAANNDINGETTPSFNASYMTPITETFGIAAAVSHEQRSTRTDAQSNWNWWEASHPDTGKSLGFYPENYSVSSKETERERSSVMVNLQWQPADNIDTFLDMSYNKLSVEEEAHSFGGHLWSFTDASVNIDSVVTDPNTNTITQMGIDRWFIDPSDEKIKEDVESITLQLGGEIELGQFIVAGALGYSKAETDKLTQRVHIIDHWVTNDDKHDGKYKIGADRQFEYLSYGSEFYDPASTTNDEGDDLNKPIFGPMMREPEANSDSNLSFNFDVEYLLDDNTVLSSVETGISYQKREKQTFTASQHLGPWELMTREDGATLWNDGQALLHEDISSVYEPDNFMAGNSGAGVPTRWNAITDFDGALAAYADRVNEFYGFSQGDESFVSDYESFYRVMGMTPDRRGSADNTEESQAVYVQANIDALGSSLVGNVGLRYVNTELTSSALVGDAYLATHGGELDTIVKTKDYSNVLPSLNLSYHLNDSMIVRFAAAKVMARPDFDNAKAGATVTADGWQEEDGWQDGSSFTDNDSYVGGSVELDPYEATQFDLAYEWYFSDSNMLSAGLFYKDIESYIFTQNIVGGGVVEGHETEVVDRAPYPTSDTSNGEVALPDGQLTAAVPLYFETVQIPVNGSGGKIQGIELAYQHNFDFLPGIWSNLGVLANFTMTDSSADYFKDSLGNEEVDLPFLDQSEHAYNLMGYYQSENLMVRLAYNWRSESLHNAANTDNNVIWRDAYGQLDGSFSYLMNNGFELVGSVSNLLEESDQYFSAALSDGNLVDGASVPRDRNWNQTHNGRTYRLGLRYEF